MTNPSDTPKPPAPPSATPPPKPFPTAKPNAFNANNQNYKAMMNNKGKNMSHGIQSHGQGRGGGGNKGRGGK